MAFATWFVRVILQGNARNTASSGSGVPTNALLDEDGMPLLDEDGAYLLEP